MAGQTDASEPSGHTAPAKMPREAMPGSVCWVVLQNEPSTATAAHESDTKTACGEVTPPTTAWVTGLQRGILKRGQECECLRQK